MEAHDVVSVGGGIAGAIGAGTCAVGAFDQEKMNHLVEVDGEDEFVISMAPVGKILDKK